MMNRLLLEFFTSIRETDDTVNSSNQSDKIKMIEPGKAYKTSSGKWGARKSVGDRIEYFDTEEQAMNWLRGMGSPKQQDGQSQKRKRRSDPNAQSVKKDTKDKKSKKSKLDAKPIVKFSKLTHVIFDQMNDARLFDKRGVPNEYIRKNGELNVDKIKGVVNEYIKTLSEEEVTSLTEILNSGNFDKLNSLRFFSMARGTNRRMGKYSHFNSPKDLIRALELDVFPSKFKAVRPQVMLAKKNIDNHIGNISHRHAKIFFRNVIDPKPLITFEEKKANIHHFLGEGQHNEYWENLNSIVRADFIDPKILVKSFEKDKKFKSLYGTLVKKLKIDGPKHTDRRRKLKVAMLKSLVSSDYGTTNFQEDLKHNLKEAIKELFITDESTEQHIIEVNERVNAAINNLNKSLTKTIVSLTADNRIALHLEREINNYRSVLNEVSAEINKLETLPDENTFLEFRNRVDDAFANIFSNLDDSGLLTAAQVRKTALKILAKSSEAHEYFREIIAGDEVYLPAIANFPCGDKIKITRTNSENPMERVLISLISVKSKGATSSSGAESEFSKYPFWEGIYKNFSKWGLGWKRTQPYQMSTEYADDETKFKKIIEDSNAGDMFNNPERQEEFRQLIVNLQNFAMGEDTTETVEIDGKMVTIKPHQMLMKNRVFGRTDLYSGDYNMRSYASPTSEIDDDITKERKQIYQELKKKTNLMFSGDEAAGDSYIGYMIENIRLSPPNIKKKIVDEFSNIVQQKKKTKKQTLDLIDVPQTMEKVSELIYSHYFDIDKLKQYMGNEINFTESMRRGPAYVHAAIAVGGALNAHNHYNHMTSHMHYDVTIPERGKTNLEIKKMENARDLSDWKLKLDLFQGVSGAWKLSGHKAGFGGAVRIRRQPKDM